MTHTMYDAFDTGMQASNAYVRNYFHYNDPNDVNLKNYSLAFHYFLELLYSEIMYA